MAPSLSLYESLYLAVSVLGLIASGLGYLFRYPEDHFSTVMSEEEEQRWNTACYEFGQIVADLYEDIDNSANYFTSDLANPEDVSTYLEEFFEGPEDFQELEKALQSVKRPKIIKSRCWTGAFFAPLSFLITAGSGVILLFIDDELFYQVVSVVGGIFFLLGLLFTAIFIWYRRQMQTLSDNQQFMT